ncbi:hypothetical protein AAE349_004290 [Escherichia coli]|nr:hypothetical protein [Escherichia coli]EFB1911205.1 hypothetical protein [Escherichia coli]
MNKMKYSTVLNEWNFKYDSAEQFANSHFLYIHNFMNDQSQLLGIIIPDFLKVPQKELLPIQVAIDNLVSLLKIQTSRSLTADEGLDLAQCLTQYLRQTQSYDAVSGMCPVGQKFNFFLNIYPRKGNKEFSLRLFAITTLNEIISVSEFVEMAHSTQQSDLINNPGYFV